MTSKVQPEIVVEISLLPTAGGGRQRPISEGEYRGILGVGQENFLFVSSFRSQEG